MKIIREGKEFALTAEEILEAHKEFVTNWMTDTLIQDFDMEEEDAKEVTVTAYDCYSEGNGKTEYEAVEWAHQQWEKEQENKKSFLVECLSTHVGHDVSIVYYGTEDNIVDICLECEDCSEVVLDAELYTITEKNSTDEKANDRLWNLLKRYIGKNVWITNPVEKRYFLVCKDNDDVILDTKKYELCAREDI